MIIKNVLNWYDDEVAKSTKECSISLKAITIFFFYQCKISYINFIKKSNLKPNENCQSDKEKKSN